MPRRNMPWGNIPRPRSRYGACVVLNRECNSQCIFAPYFRCEDAIAHFVAIHDVFTVKNVVNFLAPLPVSDQFWAFDTLLFETQAQLQDPVYGCVSHILSLQQQVSELQAYRAYLQDSLFAYYSLYPQPIPQPDQNPSWNFDLPIIPEDVPHLSFSEATLPPYPGEASSSQMPPPNDIDELGPVVFGNHCPH
ncbi:LOB domain-containing protein 18-like [Diospyros lotus]|uniref:LOB domain-containing protein 18-like n=1 Tax=Diospyros lotus TaxID=55363 RepID=UPI002257151F|nr:LOB domain-containing protein 18-like [Diospyros lotus]